MGALRCGPSGRSRTSSGPGTCPYLIRLGGVAHAPHHDPGRTPLGWSLVPGKRPFTPTWRVADNAATTAARTLGGNRGVVHATVRIFFPAPRQPHAVRRVVVLVFVFVRLFANVPVVFIFVFVFAVAVAFRAPLRLPLRPAQVAVVFFVVRFAMTNRRKSRRWSMPCLLCCADLIPFDHEQDEPTPPSSPARGARTPSRGGAGSALAPAGARSAALFLSRGS